MSRRFQAILVLSPNLRFWTYLRIHGGYFTREGLFVSMITMTDLRTKKVPGLVFVLP